MADQKLTERSSISSSKDDSYVHIVQDGASLKQTKGNFLREDRGRITDLEVTKFSNTTRINNLESNQYSGVITYETLAILQAVTGIENTSYKVTNDPDTSLNGYYHWSGSAYVKDAESANGVVESGEVEAVDGGEVFDYTGKFGTGRLKSTESVLVGNYINPSGVLSTQVGFKVKSYTCSVGEELVVAGICGGAVAQHAFYSDSGLTNLIEVGDDNGISSVVNEINYIVKVPASANYIALTEKITEGEMFCYDLAGSQNVLEDIIAENNTNNSENKTYQTIDNSFTTIANSYLSNTGVLSSLSNFEVKKYAVTEGDYYKIDSYNNGNIAVYAFYSDSGLTTLVELGQVFAGVDSFNGIIKVPTGATYLGTTTRTSDSQWYTNTYVQNNVDVDLTIINETLSDLSNKIINAYGDSLTFGAGGGGTTYLTVLEGLLGSDYSYNNLGVGGETSQTIGFRQGGIPALLENNVSLPADTSKVAIGTTNDSGLISVWNGLTVKPLQQTTTVLNPVYIDNIECTLSYDGGTTYNLNRVTAGTARTLYAGETVYTINQSEYNNGVSIIYVGTNSGSFTDEADLIGQIKSFIDFTKTKRYIVVGIHYSSTFSAFDNLEAEMYKAFGNKYYNNRRYMLGNALIDAGITPTAQDVIDIAAGNVPSSLLADSVHFTAQGYDLIGTNIYKIGKYLGYW